MKLQVNLLLAWSFTPPPFLPPLLGSHRAWELEEVYILGRVNDLEWRNVCFFCFVNKERQKEKHTRNAKSVHAGPVIVGLTTKDIHSSCSDQDGEEQNWPKK